MKMENVLKLNSEYGDTLMVMPNYTCKDDGWENSIGKSEPFFIEIQEDDREESCIGLNLENATLLRDFLTEKINYLSQK